MRATVVAILLIAACGSSADERARKRYAGLRCFANVTPIVNLAREDAALRSHGDRAHREVVDAMELPKSEGGRRIAISTEPARED